MTTAPKSGRLIGIGTGPGDPELLTLKAVRALAEADVVAHFAKRNGNGNARAIVAAHMKPGVAELPLHYPVTVEIDKDHADYKAQILAFYERRSRRTSKPAEPWRCSLKATRCSTAPTCTCMCASPIASRPR